MMIGEYDNMLDAIYHEWLYLTSVQRAFISIEHTAFALRQVLKHIDGL